MSGEQNNCAEHDWWFEVGDTCPVCEGINAEQARIIKLLEEMPDDYWTRLGGFANKVDRAELIELIKGETE